MDCLVTKLKASVDADLPILGAVKMNVNIPQDYEYGTSSYFRCEPYSTDHPLTLTVLGNGFFRNKTTGENLGKVMQSSGPTELCLSPGQYSVKIESKYDIGILRFAENFANAGFPLAELAFSRELSVVRVTNAPNVFGAIEELCEGIFGLGRVSGDIDFTANALITLNSKSVGPYAMTFTFNSTGCVVLYGTATVATLVNGVWSYYDRFA